MGKTPPLMKNPAFVFGGLTGFGTAYWFAIRPQHLRWGAEPGAFVMERKMLLGIKQRAERLS